MIKNKNLLSSNKESEPDNLKSTPKVIGRTITRNVDRICIDIANYILMLFSPIDAAYILSITNVSLKKNGYLISGAFSIFTDSSCGSKLNEGTSLLTATKYYTKGGFIIFTYNDGTAVDGFLILSTESTPYWTSTTSCSKFLSIIPMISNSSSVASCTNTQLNPNCNMFSDSACITSYHTNSNIPYDSTVSTFSFFATSSCLSLICDIVDAGNKNLGKLISGIDDIGKIYLNRCIAIWAPLTTSRIDPPLATIYSDSLCTTKASTIIGGNVYYINKNTVKSLDISHWITFYDSANNQVLKINLDTFPDEYYEGTSRIFDVPKGEWSFYTMYLLDKQNVTVFDSHNTEIPVQSPLFSGGSVVIDSDKTTGYVILTPSFSGYSPIIKVDYSYKDTAKVFDIDPLFITSQYCCGTNRHTKFGIWDPIIGNVGASINITSLKISISEESAILLNKVGMFIDFIQTLDVPVLNSISARSRTILGNKTFVVTDIPDILLSKDLTIPLGIDINYDDANIAKVETHISNLTLWASSSSLNCVLESCIHSAMNH